MSKNTMKTLLMVALLLVSFFSFATNYYFSSSTGDDSRSSAQAQSTATPWKTLTKLNSIFSTLSPGDTLFLKRGDIFYGQILPTASGSLGSPIVITGYGLGADKPEISGLTNMAIWTSETQNVWSCQSSQLGSFVKTVLRNDTLKEMGRYPNNSYLSFESHVSNTSITDNQLTGTPDWDGADVVIKKYLYVIDHNTITSHSGTTINYTSGSVYSPIADGWGYFIQNHLSTLDRDGEWYYNPSTKRLYMYFDNNDPCSYDVRASSVDMLVSDTTVSNLVFNNLTFKGANRNSIYLLVGSNVQIKSCNILFSGEDGIYMVDYDDLVVENNNIQYSGNNGMYFQYDVNESVIRSNTIEHTMPFVGSAKSGDVAGVGISIAGTGNLVEYNQIKHTGFNGIFFQGNEDTIKNNLIDSFALYKGDAGGVYTYVGDIFTAFSGRRISGNIIMNGIGSLDGTTEAFTLTQGLYMDYNISGVDIRDNTIVNCSGYGLYVNNSSDLSIKYNTFYNNGTSQLYIRQAVPAGVRNNTIVNNIFFSKNLNDFSSTLNSLDNDLGSFATFDSNYYLRPFRDTLTILTAYQNATGQSTSSAYSLADWKPRYSEDANAQSSPTLIAGYSVSSVVGSNKFVNPSFTSNIGSVFVYSEVGNATGSWNSGGQLDGGAFALSYAANTGTSNFTLINGSVGSITGGKTYRLRFSLKGTNGTGPSLSAYLRRAVDPYDKLSDVKYFKIAGSRTENEAILTVPNSVSLADLIFEMNDQSTGLYLDNIEVIEANVTFTNPATHFLFDYNFSSSNKVVNFSGTYKDARGNSYTGSITLLPYTSTVLIKQ